ncbi:hypothetical protein, partial [Thermoleptolyngbya sp.]
MSSAATFTEVGDAGQTLNTAQFANTRVAGTQLTAILGTLGGNADLFGIQIKNSAGQFMASTGNLGKTAFEDTQLFLFDSEGRALFANDNTPDNDPGRANPGTKRSTLRLPRNTIPDGLYFLAISGYNYDPVDSAGNLLFSDTRADRNKLVSALNPGSRLGGWVGRPGYVGPILDYQIDLVGAEFTSLVSPIPPPTPTPTPT